MGGSLEPIQIPLTAEQQEMIRRLSGQFAQVLELLPESGDPAGGTGRALQFRWRLSTTSGIPRQAWGANEPPAAPPEGTEGS